LGVCWGRFGRSKWRTRKLSSCGLLLLLLITITLPLFPLLLLLLLLLLLPFLLQRCLIW
jgi:hypothetical protein